MAHHPTGIQPGDGAGPMTLSTLVHAAMIVLLAANLWGLIIFTARLGFDGWMLAGVLSYGLSVIANVMAGLINGFIVPAVADAVDRAASADIFVLLWESNQAAARLAVYAAGIAFVSWSVRLIRLGTPEHIALGGMGMVAGVTPTMALYTRVITLDVDGALLAYGAQAAWVGLLGLQMIRRRLKRAAYSGTIAPITSRRALM
jgi:hypothetical protein